jgi:hypothetical protein
MKELKTWGQTLSIVHLLSIACPECDEIIINSNYHDRIVGFKPPDIFIYKCPNCDTLVWGHNETDQNFIELLQQKGIWPKDR